MGDDYLAVKVKPELTDEDMKAFADQLSSLMANVSIDLNTGENGGTTTSSSGQSSSGGGTLTDADAEKIKDAGVGVQQEMAVGKGMSILSKVQEPTTEATKSMKEQLGSALEGTKELCGSIFGGVTAIFTLAKKATEGPLNTVLGIMEKLFNLVFLPLNIALTMTMIPIMQSMAQRIGAFVQSALKMYEEKGLAGIIEATFSTLWEVFLPVLSILWDAFIQIIPKAWISLFNSGGLGTCLALLTAIIPIIGAYIAITKTWQIAKMIIDVARTVALLGLTTPVLLILGAIIAVVTAITLIALNWDAFKKWCEDVWTGIVDFFKNIIKFWTELPTIIWNAISKIGGDIWNNLTSWIPHFASGGVVGANNPQLAWIGDNNTEPEVVAPYSTIVSAVGQALNNNTQLTTNNNKTNGMVVNNYYTISGTNAEQIADETMRLMDKSVTKSTSKWGM